MKISIKLATLDGDSFTCNAVEKNKYLYFTRVPSIGEHVKIENDIFIVKDVIHFPSQLNKESFPEAEIVISRNGQ